MTQTSPIAQGLRLMIRQLFILTVFAFANSSYCSAQQFVSFYGTAVDVYDGDVFTLQLSNSSRMFMQQLLTPLEFRLGRVQVQLQGIDTPERSSNQPYWREARSQLARHIDRQTVNVQTLLTSRGQLNRSPAGIVGVVRAGRSGKPVNLAMIETGLAKDDWRVSFGMPYVRAQQLAMSRRLGIWQDPRQYDAENRFRIQLYGTERPRGESRLAPHPDGQLSANGKPESFSRKSPFPRVGVGKGEWQKGFGNDKRPGVPRVKN